MYGRAESLNLSTAAAVFLYATHRPARPQSSAGTVPEPVGTGRQKSLTRGSCQPVDRSPDTVGRNHCRARRQIDGPAKTPEKSFLGHP